MLSRKTIFRVFIVLITIIFLLSPHVQAGTARIKACMLVNLSTGQTLYQKNPDLQIPPASLAKLMTMFITLDSVKNGKISLNQKITISAEAANAGGSAMHLSPGEKVPVIRLLAGMAVASGNDAATALAQKLAGSTVKFTAQMNAKAKNLGMSKTTYKNPTGLPAVGQKTTARDLMKLCSAYLKAHPQTKRFHSMKFYMHKGMVIRNTNPLLGSVKGVDGLKTGWTIASGYNLIVTATRGKNRLLAIVLGGQSKQARDTAVTTLLEAGFNNPRNPKAVAKALAAF